MVEGKPSALALQYQRQWIAEHPETIITPLPKMSYTYPLDDELLARMRWAPSPEADVWAARQAEKVAA